MKRALTASLLLSLAAGATDLRIQNNNGGGQGFNDPTPVAPQGLNYATTRGAQALISFQFAAAVWNATVKSTPSTLIDAAFVTPAQDSDVQCTATSGLLGYTRPTTYEVGSSLPNPNVGYVAALANALAGKDLTAGQAHIKTRFNAGIGTASCLSGISWYYGLDNNTDGSHVSLLATMLHEFAHGLGFTSFVDPSSGAIGTVPAAFDEHVYDEKAGMDWANYSTSQRAPLLTAGTDLTFDGPQVSASLASFLADSPALIFASNGTTSTSDFQPGQFSGPIPDGGPVPIVAANPLDACSALTPGSLTGDLALVERGTCNFQDKAEHAVAAGAAGVVIFDNDAGTLLTMAGTDGGVLDAPAVFITNADGTAALQRIQGGATTGQFGTSGHLSNTDASQTRPLLYTPSTVSPGSTLSHFNEGTYPRGLLMEPYLSPTARLNLDLTPAALEDMGWPVVHGISVGITKAEDPTLASGGVAHYLIAVLNRRTVPVGGVQLNLTLPGGATVTSVTGACTALPCTLGTLQGGDVQPVVVAVQAPSKPTFPFVVTANLSAPTTDADDNLSASNSADQASGGGGCSSAGSSGAIAGVLLAMAMALVQTFRARSRSALCATPCRKSK